MDVPVTARRIPSGSVDLSLLSQHWQDAGHASRQCLANVCWNRAAAYLRCSISPGPQDNRNAISPAAKVADWGHSTKTCGTGGDSRRWGRSPRLSHAACLWLIKSITPRSSYCYLWHGYLLFSFDVRDGVQLGGPGRQLMTLTARPAPPLCHCRSSPSRLLRYSRAAGGARHVPR